MKYYKDENNHVYAFEADGSQDAYIPTHLVPITKVEADELRNPPLTPEQVQQVINDNARAYLASTDWMVQRHNDQLNLGINTSLTSDEYIKLLQDRQAARDSII